MSTQAQTWLEFGRTYICTEAKCQGTGIVKRFLAGMMLPLSIILSELKIWVNELFLFSSKHNSEMSKSHSGTFSLLDAVRKSLGNPSNLLTIRRGEE